MKVVIDGLMTEYVDIGKGKKTILFLHGWGSSATAFNDLFGALCGKKYRVVGLNFPGFGGSGEPPEAWSVGDYTDFAKKFIKKIDLKKIHAIIGHSFGGRVMLKGISSGAFKANKLIFLDSAGIKPYTTVTRKILHLGKPFAKLPVIKQLAVKLRSSDYAATSGVMREVFKKVVDEDLTRYMPAIKQPTLLIWGADDVETPVADAKVFAEKIKDSKLEIIPNAGHYVFLDQPEKTVKLIKDFL
jgi:pimeloyl-ACP methyl ester carboxylesterase